MGALFSTEKLPESTMVKNVNGTSADRYKIDKLYQQYLDSGAHDPANCQVKGCSKPASATAHVIRAGQNVSKRWMLTRLCAEHNHHSNKSEMPLSVILR
jgi:hypothetical protein